MCGIVSFVLKDAKKVLGPEYIKIFKEMLYVNGVRGLDATGIASIKENNEVTLIKDIGTPLQLYNTYTDATWDLKSKILIGHNRSATKGHITKDNAHPFQEGNITLIHNGTLHYHSHLKNNVDVDSHAITHSINDEGSIKTLEKLNGAFALVWNDSKTNRVYATRNEQRPLYILETEDLFIIASENKMVEWICHRYNIKINKSVFCVPHTLYEFLISSKKRYYIKTYTYNKYKPYYNETTNITTYRNKLDDIPFPETNLKTGMVVQALAYTSNKLGYKSYNIGNIRWNVDILDHDEENAVCEVYTDTNEDFTEHQIEFEIVQLYKNFLTKSWTVVGKNPKLIHKDINKKKHLPENKGHITSSNGFLITPKIIKECKDLLCIFCSEPFYADTNIELKPIVKDGHIYKYQYRCAACVEDLNYQRRLKSGYHI
jgi:predicted glutamine amidotransferase